MGSARRCPGLGQRDMVLTSSSATCDLGDLLHAFDGHKACQQGGHADHMKSYIQAPVTTPHLGNHRRHHPCCLWHLHDMKAQRRGSEVAAGEDELQRMGPSALATASQANRGSIEVQGAGGESLPAGTRGAGKAGPPTGAEETQLVTDPRPPL